MDFSKITIADYLIVLATVIGPILAVQVQKRIEIWGEKRNRKLRIFYNLMATRGGRVSERHVEALNSIQLEYAASPKGKGKKVRDSWAEYHSHLNEPTGEGDDLKAWIRTGDELFTNLLHEMSQYLGYDYNRVDIQKGGYTPIAHGNREILQKSIVIGLERVLSGKEPLKVQTIDVSSPAQIDKPKKS